MNFFEKYTHMLIAVALGVGFWILTAPASRSGQEGTAEKVDLPPVQIVEPLVDFPLKRDPFRMSSRGPVLINPTGSVQRKAELANIFIEGVICSPAQQSAIIGGKLYNVGEKYKEATIVSVAPDKVVLLYKGMLVEKRLNLPSVQIQPEGTP